MQQLRLDREEKKTLVSVVALLVVIMIGLYFIAPRHKAGTSSFGGNYNLVFQDYDGKKVSLISFRLKPLIVFSWATWSPYSAEEFKDLLALKQKLGDKIHIVAINRGEPISDARPFTDKLGVSADIVLLLDSEDAYYKSIQGYAMPETMFISASGDQRLHQRGPMDEASLEAGVQSSY